MSGLARRDNDLRKSAEASVPDSISVTLTKRAAGRSGDGADVPAKRCRLTRMHASGESASTIANTLGVSLATLYRYLDESGAA